MCLRSCLKMSKSRLQNTKAALPRIDCNCFSPFRLVYYLSLLNDLVKGEDAEVKVAVGSVVDLQ